MTEKPKTVNETLELAIAWIAGSIRNDWTNVNERLRIIRSLCLLLDTDQSKEWIDQINENCIAIIEDGRWMRDFWKGPYRTDY